MGQITNLDYLKEIAGDDLEFLKEMFETFRGQVPVFSGNMKRYLESQDYPLLAREAHTAKSSVMLFGLNDLSVMLKSFQLLAEKGKEAWRYPGFIEEFENTCKLAIDELQAILG